MLQLACDVPRINQSIAKKVWVGKLHQVKHRVKVFNNTIQLR